MPIRIPPSQEREDPTVEDLSDNLAEEFIKAAHQIAAHGLVCCGSGNLSRRISRDRMLVTARSAWMEDLREEQVALCDIRDGRCINRMEPSIEIGLHRAVLSKREDIDVVLHFQSPYATALACSKKVETNLYVIPEVPYHIGPVAAIPYMTPGSEELAEAAGAAMAGHNVAILGNHGEVTVGKDFREAIQRALFFELACTILFKAGDQATRLSQRDVASLQAI
ncbi:MAG: class II aldolase/adducin family protein [Desulfatiglans sp.]|jgi:ribulose-5-phosphate 4-epimerase/fuculose-1-phosphate aldolase|nr:class II aldolase/adducin family protein [Desulfatiglans sp.]